jgi:hypothetical protein
VREICEDAMHPHPASIMNGAEPDDPATRVCCKNHSGGASLPLVMHEKRTLSRCWVARGVLP